MEDKKIKTFEEAMKIHNGGKHVIRVESDIIGDGTNAHHMLLFDLAERRGWDMTAIEKEKPLIKVAKKIKK